MQRLLRKQQQRIQRARDLEAPGLRLTNPGTVIKPGGSAFQVTKE